MAKLVWEWTLGTESVRAELEMPANVESVFLARRLLSRSARGGRPDGHAVPLPGVEARVHFNAPTRECVLYVNGAPVPPTRVTSKASSSVPLLLVILVGGVFVLSVFSALAAYGVRKYVADAKTSQANVALSQKYTGPNGLLVAHYPSDFEGAGQCIGRLGYKTEGTASLGVEDVVTWSCTFVEGDHAYVFFASVNTVFDGDMPLVRRIIDATEIIGGPTAVPAIGRH